MISLAPRGRATSICTRHFNGKRRLLPAWSLLRLNSSLSQLQSTSHTQIEEENASVLAAVQAKVAEFKTALNNADDNVQAQISRAKTLKDLGPLVDAFESYTKIRHSLQDLAPHLSDPDPDLREMFATERATLLSDLDQAIVQLPELLLPVPETDPLPVLMSLNAGVGGSEAALFVDELVRMYMRFAEKRGWKLEILSQAEGPGGKGIREISLKFEPPPYSEGEGAYGSFKWEKGVHRVQRVPVTESQGRVHTSTVAVVVMPIYPDVPEAPIVDPKDVRVEVMRSRGAGGQHVNKTESAVRLTHVPTGITVSMQDSRSQHQNRAWAWDVLRARLSEKKHNEEMEARRAGRRTQVKTADRSDKIRTYNFPQDRLTDHRVGLNLTGLKDVLDGDGLELVIAALQQDFKNRRLECLVDGEGDLDE